MSVVDASVWVSLLAADDVNHEATQRWFDQQIAAGADFVAPALVLVEIAGAMARRTGDALTGMRAAARVRSLPELDLVALTVEDAEQAASIAARVALRGADAVYAALASARGRQLVTWDRQQRERSAAVVQVSSPDDELSQH
jgi:predicted nucleic acid-binding protein